jgi:LuxR family maltose regulon positive regulatory protein
VDYINRILAAFPDTESKPPLTDLRATNDEREFEAETVTPIENPKSKIQNSLIEPLTNRELDVLDLLAQRLQNKEIAEKLFVSPATVKSHLESIYQKLNVSNRREAVDKAYALKIITRR